MENEYKKFFENYFVHKRSGDLTNSLINDCQTMQDYLYEELEKKLDKQGLELLNELQEVFNLELVEKVCMAYHFGVEDNRKFIKLHT